MLNFRIDIAYDGTNYHGWQYQPDVVTVQEILEKKIQKIISDTNIKIIGSGRTDAGVHAYSQVANFFLDTTLNEIQIRNALNKETVLDI